MELAPTRAPPPITPLIRCIHQGYAQRDKEAARSSKRAQRVETAPAARQARHAPSAGDQGRRQEADTVGRKMWRRRGALCCRGGLVLATRTRTPLKEALRALRTWARAAGWPAGRRAWRRRARTLGEAPARAPRCRPAWSSCDSGGRRAWEAQRLGEVNSGTWTEGWGWRPRWRGRWRSGGRQGWERQRSPRPRGRRAA